VSAPSGCPFAGRCPLTLDACRATPLPTVEFEADHRVRCIRIDSEGRLA
jgi:peptide/nickel transport system ATP-binding protein